MTRSKLHIFLAFGLAIAALTFAAAPAAADSASRDGQRASLQRLLNEAGPKIGVEFHQSEKAPYNFVGTLSSGLKNANSLEIVVGVGTQDTIFFRVYPHYAKGYINLKKAQDKVGLMHQMLRYCDDNFLFWGADDSDDIFAGYGFTLESGFPDAAMTAVVRSIPNLDQYVGEMRPLIDGSSAIK